MSENTETEELMLAEAGRQLKERLNEVRAKEHFNALSVRAPEVWMRVAKRVFRGDQIIKIMSQEKVSQATVYKIQKQILDIRDNFKQYQVDNIDANLMAIDDITAEELERMRCGGVVLLDHAKAIKELTVTGQILAQRRGKLVGDADTVVEHRRAKTPEEYAKDAEAFFNDIQEAEVIDG